eukprot:m.127341 g.127341  ORF g.127341 m.127341 type:complete len:50 (-) comp15799_c0_seq12:169-318(-)
MLFEARLTFVELAAKWTGLGVPLLFRWFIHDWWLDEVRSASVKLSSILC